MRLRAPLKSIFTSSLAVAALSVWVGLVAPTESTVGTSKAPWIGVSVARAAGSLIPTPAAQAVEIHTLIDQDRYWLAHRARAKVLALAMFEKYKKEYPNHDPRLTPAVLAQVLEIHDEEKFVQEFREFLFKNFGADFGVLPPEEKAARLRRLGDLNTLGEQMFDRLMDKLGFPTQIDAQGRRVLHPVAQEAHMWELFGDLGDRSTNRHAALELGRTPWPSSSRETDPFKKKIWLDIEANGKAITRGMDYSPGRTLLPPCKPQEALKKLLLHSAP